MKKIPTAIIAIIIVLFLGAVGSRIAEREIFPRLAETEFFGEYAFFQNVKKNTTVIEKTEQVIVREDDSINAVSSQASTSVVRIISREDATRLRQATVHEGVGVIMTSDGVIATHKSALTQGTSVVHLVLLSDGALHGATLLGIDAFSDIAFLRIDTENLTSIGLANSDDARAGKKLIAIGAALEKNQNRYALGLLSHVNKVNNMSGTEVSSSERHDGFFDVDFNTLDEYSGAPVIDFNGEMIGIVGRIDAILKEEFGNEDAQSNANVLVPSNVVRDALTRVVRNQEQDVETLPLGITYRSITKSYAAAYETQRDHGAIIITPGTRGLRAGLRAGDIVTMVNEQEIDLDHALSNTLNALPNLNTEKMIITIVRDKTERTLSL